MALVWDKIGKIVKNVVKVTANVAALIPKALVYPVRKPFASLDQIKHDAKVSLKKAVGINVPEEEKKYNPAIETTKASEGFGLQIKEHKEKGKVTFLVSKTLVGDVPYLNDEQLDAIKKCLPNATVFREENRVVIEVDIEKITNCISSDPKRRSCLGKMKRLVLREIYNEIDRNFKSLAEITGGEFKIHTDRKLLSGIAEKLCNEYDSQDKSVAEQFSMTNPSQFPFKETNISPMKRKRLLRGVKEQGWVGGTCSLKVKKDVSPNERVESPIASAIRNEKRKQEGLEI